MEVKEMVEQAAEHVKGLQTEIKTQAQTIEALKSENKTLSENAQKTAKEFNEFKGLAVTKDEVDKVIAEMEQKSKSYVENLKSSRRATIVDAIKEAINDNKDLIKKSIPSSVIEFSTKDLISNDSVSLADGNTLINPMFTSVNAGLFKPNTVPHVRSFIPTGSMGGEQVHFTELIPGSQLPDYQVNQGDLKQELSVTFKTKVANVVTIAGWIPIAEQMRDDVSYLESSVSQQITEMLLQKEDAEVLYGTGTESSTTALRGLFTEATLVPAESIDLFIYDKILTAVKYLSVNGYYTANAIIMSTSDYIDALKLKDTTNQYLIQQSPFVGGLPTVMGIPILALPQVNIGDVLVAELSSLTTQLLFKQGLNVQIGRINDDFVRNKYVIRVEERVAMPIYRPKALAKITLTQTT